MLDVPVCNMVAISTVLDSPGEIPEHVKHARVVSDGIILDVDELQELLDA